MVNTLNLKLEKGGINILLFIFFIQAETRANCSSDLAVCLLVLFNGPLPITKLRVLSNDGENRGLDFFQLLNVFIYLTINDPVENPLKLGLALKMWSQYMHVYFKSVIETYREIYF